MYRGVGVSGWAFNDMESFLLRWVAPQAAGRRLGRWRCVFEGPPRRIATPKGGSCKQLPSSNRELLEVVAAE
jgi:hypothetical protein